MYATHTKLPKNRKNDKSPVIVGTFSLAVFGIKFQKSEIVFIASELLPQVPFHIGIFVWAVAYGPPYYVHS